MGAWHEGSTKVEVHQAVIGTGGIQGSVSSTRCHDREETATYLATRAFIVLVPLIRVNESLQSAFTACSVPRKFGHSGHHALALVTCFNKTRHSPYTCCPQNRLYTR